MATDPLRAIGGWRAQEGALESGVPVAVVGICWYYALDLLRAAASGSPYTPLELLTVLGAAVALVGWTTGRQLVIYGKKKPWMAAVFGAVAGLLSLLTLRNMVVSGFETACADTFAGLIVQIRALDGSELSQTACRVGGVPHNPYLPGTLIYPAWSGALPTWQWPTFAGIGALASLGLRDRRLRRSTVVERLDLRRRQGV